MKDYVNIVTSRKVAQRAYHVSLVALIISASILAMRVLQLYQESGGSSQ